MNSKHVVFMALVILPGLCSAQLQDSLVYFEDLTFQNPAEEAAFNQYFIEGKKDVFLLLSSAGNNISAEELQQNRNHFDQWMAQFETEKFNTQKEAKKIKLIDKKIHSDYFQTYDENAYFSYLFSGKVFSEITASALMAVVLDRLNIPYSIKQSYEHAYVVAYPQTNAIVMEAVDPLTLMIIYTPQAKGEFINYLINTNQINEDEVKARPVDDLFKEYYFKEKETNLMALAASLYYNNAVLLFEKQLFKDAFRMAEKSYFLYPEKKTGHLLLTCIGMELNSCQYTDMKFIPYVYKASRYQSYGIGTEEISDEFIKITQLVLISQYDVELYCKMYEEITNHISDDSIKLEVSFIYHYERGRLLQNEGKYDESLFYTEKAYELKPTHMEARSLFLSSMVFSLSNIPDPKDALLKMEEYTASFPDLTSNSNFTNIRYILLLGLSVDQFTRGNYTDGFFYLHSFENAAGDKQIQSIPFHVQNILVEAYSLAASYYFRKGNYSKAKLYLEHGLQYVPGSWELENKMRAVK